MGTKIIHIIKRGEKWAIKKEGNTRASKIQLDLHSAVSDARKYLDKGYRLIIHNENGSIF